MLIQSLIWIWLVHLCLLNDIFKVNTLIGAEATGAHVEENNNNNAATAIPNENNDDDTPLSPVVLVPGLMSSRLEAKITNTSNLPHSYCLRKLHQHQQQQHYNKSDSRDDYIPIWINHNFIIPGESDCLAYYMSLQIDEKASMDLAHQTKNPNAIIQRDSLGISVRAVDMGGLKGVSYLDPMLHIGSIFQHMIHWLEETLGYNKNGKGEDIVGAPFDWRLGPLDLERRGYFTNLQQVIERTVNNNNSKNNKEKRGATLIAHSLGNLVVMEFLHRMTQSWKDQYISSYVAVSPPFAGAVAALEFVASGMQIKARWIPDQSVDVVGLSMASPAWLMPTANVFGKKNKKMGPLIQTPSKSYIANDIYQLYIDLHLTNSTGRLYQCYANTTSLTNFQSPSVSSHIVYGTDIPTPLQYIYPKDLKPFDPTMVDENLPQPGIMGDGDGTVNVESLRVAEDYWKDDDDKIDLTITRVKHADHHGILDSTELLDVLKRVLMSGEDDDDEEKNNNLNSAIF